MWRVVLGIASIVGAALLVAAAPDGGGGMGRGGGPAGGMHDSSAAYMEHVQVMHDEMSSVVMGDTDLDFARLMIAHHQGAIDMAQVELEYGTDPDLKAIAQRVITDQTAEIQELEMWLQMHEPATSDAPQHR